MSISTFPIILKAYNLMWLFLCEQFENNILERKNPDSLNLNSLKNQVTEILKSKCLMKSGRLTCTYLEDTLQTNFFRQGFKGRQFTTCESFISYCILQWLCSMLLIQCYFNDYFS